MSGVHGPLLPGLGYEEPTRTSLGQVATWIVFSAMTIGTFSAVAFEAGWLLSAAEGLSFLVVLPAYVVISRRAGGLGRISWTNLVLIVLLPIFMTTYAAANSKLFGSHSVRGHWDHYVPTIPAFIVPYLFTYVWVVATVTFFALRLLNRQLRTLVVAGLLCVSTAILTFILFQTDVNTIALSHHSYGDFLGSWMRYMDEHMFSIPDYGDFPSVHVAWSVTLAIAWFRRGRPLWSTGAVILAALIIVATQVLHQHTLMAAAYGIIVGLAMNAFAWLLLEYFPALRRARSATSS